MTFYENFMACASKEEKEEMVNLYLKTYPVFDKDQPTVEEFINLKEGERLETLPY